ncbi:armadillo repeat-containing protein 7-like [Anopheles albimanus]|uniref:armadillo repeat-containing protein 7-like n=1 Tax=Anopheles albimanus TaxID=7167 RepID=UPI00163F0E5E|nr:armadillo repeat-containing protein 7-like [Anopheles albimanus]
MFRCWIFKGETRNMFSTLEHLKRRTPEGGINRRTYIQLLVDEYYETSNVEAHQQVTANLANFAYDPINWRFLQEAKAHELFYEILGERIVDRLLALHAIVGLTNISLDPGIAEYLVRSNGLKRLVELLEKYSTDCEIVCNVLTCLTFLLNPERSQVLLRDQKLSSLLVHLKQNTNPRISNLAVVLSEDLKQK